MSTSPVPKDRCLYCHGPLTRPTSWVESASGRIAFDPKRGRTWTVCDSCHGWNLWPLEISERAIDRLEATARGSAHLLYQTDNVGLFETDHAELIRVGAARLPEEAWWRYGRTLRRRRAHYLSSLTRLGAATYGAVSYVGSSLGFSGITGRFEYADDAYADILRWRSFGRTAWIGRAPCPQCNSVLLKLLFEKSNALHLLSGSGGRLRIGLPCSRCDPWTIEKVHSLEGGLAEEVLRRVLAYRNVAGASERDLRGAVRVIRGAGSAPALLERLAADRPALHELDPVSSLALEISVNERSERRQLALELAALEARWRRAEELAAIVDHELNSGEIDRSGASD